MAFAGSPFPGILGSEKPCKQGNAQLMSYLTKDLGAVRLGELASHVPVIGPGEVTVESPVGPFPEDYGAWIYNESWVFCERKRRSLSSSHSYWGSSVLSPETTRRKRVTGAISTSRPSHIRVQANEGLVEVTCDGLCPSVNSFLRRRYGRDANSPLIMSAYLAGCLYAIRLATLADSRPLLVQRNNYVDIDKSAGDIVASKNGYLRVATGIYKGSLASSDHTKSPSKIKDLMENIPHDPSLSMPRTEPDPSNRNARIRCEIVSGRLGLRLLEARCPEFPVLGHSFLHLSGTMSVQCRSIRQQLEKKGRRSSVYANIAVSRSLSSYQATTHAQQKPYLTYPSLRGNRLSFRPYSNGEGYENDVLHWKPIFMLSDFYGHNDMDMLEMIQSSTRALLLFDGHQHQISIDAHPARYWSGGSQNGTLFLLASISLFSLRDGLCQDGNWPDQLDEPATALFNLTESLWIERTDSIRLGKSETLDEAFRIPNHVPS
ncbi:hypothetical protein EDD15DRAFT_2194578 [Pisolithus albus]|nr:hypothetical protein EDD15DRAFT_2194578 [Pisolithus albus]